MVVKKPLRKIKNVKIENWYGTVAYGYGLVECGYGQAELRYARVGLIKIIAVFDILCILLTFW